MKFKLSFTLASAAVCALLIGCASKLPASEKSPKNNNWVVNSGDGTVNNGRDEEISVYKTISISNFTRIDVSRGIRVILIPGKFNGKAEIATTESAAPYLKVSVSNNCLRVRYEGTFKSINGPSIVTVQTPKINSVSLSSAGSLEVQGNLKTDRLTFDLSSAGSVDLDDVTCDELEIDLSSASSLRAGIVECNDVEIDVSSAASVNIEKVVGEFLDIDSSSASHISINGFEAPGGKLKIEASSTVKANVSGIKCRSISAEASSMASISLRGTCKSISKETSTGGSVKTSGLKSSNED